MFPGPSCIAANGIEIAVHEDGGDAAVIFRHNFPELAYFWRYQPGAVADAGFRAIAPDLRGYGRTGKPDGVEHHAIQELIADMTGLLDALELGSATFVGHDRDALLAGQMALLVPERMHSLVALNIPFVPGSLRHFSLLAA